MSWDKEWFDYAPVQNMICVTCKVCGAVVADWGKGEKGVDRPNQKLHKQTHANDRKPSQVVKFRGVRKDLSGDWWQFM